MAQQIINVGAAANDGTGDTLRGAFIKTDDNFDDLYANKIGGSGTDNYVPRFNGTNALENSIIFDNGTNIGIGTASPQAKLHSNSDILTGYFQNGTNGIYDALKITNNTASNNLSGNSARIQFYNNANNSTNLLGASIRSVNVDYGWASDLILSSVQNNGYASQTVNDAIYIKSSGNVGIGTTSPTGQLDVYTNSYKQFNVSYPSIYQTRLNFGTAAYAAYDAGTATLSLFATDALYGSISFGAGGSQRMRITSTGNVGIGTTTADYRTQIETTSANVFLTKNTSSTSFNRSYFHNNNNIGTQFLNFGSAYAFGTEFGVGQNGSVLQSNTTSAFAIGTTTSTPLYLGTNGTERMRITSSGNLLINGTSNFGYGKLEITYNGQTQTALDIKTTHNDGNNLRFLNSSGSVVGTIYSTTTLTSYNVTSDYRLKQDFKKFNGLDLVSKIKVYDYEWKSDNSRMNGVIAHELQEVIPYAVTGEKDGEQMQQVDYSKLVPILVQAIQELKSEIEILKTK